MKPVHFKIVQGTPFRFLVRVTQRDEDEELIPMPLTDCFVRLVARPNVASSCVLLDISSNTSQIVVDEPEGTFLIELTSAETSALVWGKPYTFSKAYFHCEIEPSDGETIRVLEGTITLDPEVVR